MIRPLPISWHVQDWSDNRVGAYVRKVLPAFQAVGDTLWVKGIDPPKDKPDWVVPGVEVLGRMFEKDGDSWADMAKGKDGAKPFYDRFIDRWLERGWVSAWTLGNEPHPPSDPTFLAALNEFLLELTRLMHLAGLKCAGPNISVGCPDVGLAPILGPAIEALDWLCLHEYSAPAMWTTYDWHIGRIFRFIQELVEAGYTNIPPAFIGEWGIDGGVAPVYQGGTSWRTWAANEQEYAQQMAWGAKMYMDHPGRVEAAFVFTVAPPGWGWDDFTPTDLLFDEVAKVVIAGYDVDEPPITPPMPEFDITDVTDELETHPDLEYGTRDKQDIDAVVVHHSGYSYPADATYDQVRAHLDVIAGYHVNTKGWPGIAYHYVVDGKGRIWQTNELETVSYHATTANSYSVGVCMLGAFHLETDPTDAQLHAVNCLVQWVELCTGKELDIIPHKQIVATACPGKVSRWWDKIAIRCDECFEEEPEEPEGGEDMAIQIVDRDGKLLDIAWEEVRDQLGLKLIEADPPEGAAVWRLKRVRLETSGETNIRIYCMDEHGDPLQGVTPWLGIQPPSGQDLPPIMAPLISGTTPAQPDGLPNRALVHADNILNFTNVLGYIQHSLGPGSNYMPPVLGGTGGGTHWEWVASGNGDEYTDVIEGIGMWDNHNLLWLEFWRFTAGGNGGELPEDGDYIMIVPEITITIPSFEVAMVRKEE